MYIIKNIKVIKIFIVLLLSLALVSCAKENKIQDDSMKVDGLTIQEETFELSAFSDEELNHYNIKASLDSEESLINANQTVTYKNIEDVDLNEIYFHLYPNAFNKTNHPSLFDADKSEISDQNGYVEIDSVKINGETVEYELGSIDTVLKINYPRAFKRNETYSIELTYVVGISSTSERFGVVDGLYNLGNWYPILAVYDEDGWNLDPYYNIGDPFYSDSSNYDVTFDVPEDFVLSSSGYASDIGMESNRKKYVLRGDRIRDFALAISDRFNIISEKVNDTTVYVYYPDELVENVFIQKSLEYAVKSIELYSDVIGMYPYKTYSVAITNFPSGMEYPAIVFISMNYFDDNITSIGRVIVHETAHQWFYGIIGNDEIEEGWIDEGMASYISSWYDLNYLDKDAYNDHITSYKSRLNEVGGKDNVTMIKSAADYSDWGEYGLAAYTKSLLMFSDLYDKYGEEKFIEFVQTLYNEYKFKILKQDDIVKVANSVFDEDLSEFFDSWLK